MTIKMIAHENNLEESKAMNFAEPKFDRLNYADQFGSNGLNPMDSLQTGSPLKAPFLFSEF